MLKKMRIVFNSIFWLVFALYLGYAFSDIFLKPFIPGALVTPSIFISGVGFFFVLRWLRTEKVQQVGRPKTEGFPFARKATTPKGFTMWDSLYSPAPQLQARALSELTDLLAQSRLQGNAQREQIERIVARATTKLEGCAGPKGCHHPGEKPI
ncbi:hypothetical protein IAD21_05498 [Abditibacteriota bacterium]|nr:hypothetical protein IAD21_05498 [Abditibacteriota bacterium]